ncbi:hypothetical protein MMAN_16080 [Mycobacterium mantenii]|uniref:Uncharacterized protein n=1 Tax=Mycobacterium mantenii TaxID=560555 RepID=A0ABM7JQB9_MYCNT|nr:hypothetical protein MMAN_16080 [Mycobacterium mantenii]
MGQASGGVEPLYQHLKRHVLVLVGCQAARSYLAQQLCDRQIPTQIDSQNQGVDEKSDQLVERRITTPGDREAHGHIVIAAQLRQEHGQGGLNHHEAGRVVLVGQPSDLLLQLCRPLHRHTGPAVIGHRRIRPISRQLQPLRHAGQGLLPVGQLRGDAAVGIGQIPQLLTLPQRVIHVLHRQRRPIRGLPGTPAGVGNAEISHQRGDRPAVGGDVMYHGDQHVLVLANAEKCCAQGDLGGQVKSVTHYRADGLLQPARRPTAGVNDLPAEVGPLSGHNQLLRYPVGRSKHGAQALLATHHVGQRHPQRLGVKAPAQPQCHWHVVNR